MLEALLLLLWMTPPSFAEPAKKPEPPISRSLPQWSADGDALYFTETVPQELFRFYELSVNGEETPLATWNPQSTKFLQRGSQLLVLHSPCLTPSSARNRDEDCLLEFNAVQGTSREVFHGAARDGFGFSKLQALWSGERGRFVLAKLGRPQSADPNRLEQRLYSLDLDHPGREVLLADLPAGDQLGLIRFSADETQALVALTNAKGERFKIQLIDFARGRIERKTLPWKGPETLVRVQATPNLSTVIFELKDAQGAAKTYAWALNGASEATALPSPWPEPSLLSPRGDVYYFTTAAGIHQQRLNGEAPSLVATGLSGIRATADGALIGIRKKDKEDPQLVLVSPARAPNLFMDRSVERVLASLHEQSADENAYVLDSEQNRAYAVIKQKTFPRGAIERSFVSIQLASGEIRRLLPTTESMRLTGPASLSPNRKWLRAESTFQSAEPQWTLIPLTRTESLE